MSPSENARARATASHAAVAPRPWRRLTPVHGDCPEAVPLLPPRHDGPLVSGAGGVDHRCWRCARVLCEGIAPGDLEGLVLRCGCGAVGRVSP